MLYVTGANKMCLGEEAEEQERQVKSAEGLLGTQERETGRCVDDDTTAGLGVGWAKERYCGTWPVCGRKLAFGRP